MGIDKLRSIIREMMEEEENLMEDYPPSFNMDEFKELRSFKARIKYCEQYLQRISSGSGRIVYKIDDEKALKLAKNPKGISQNEVEHRQGNFYDIEDITAKVFDSHENYLWIEMELARKMYATDFKRITGFLFKDFANAMHNHGAKNVTFSDFEYDVSKDIVERMWEDPFVYQMLNYMPNYDVPPQDLMRTSSYGIVKRDNEEQIVLVDFGFNQEVFKTHYKR